MRRFLLLSVFLCVMGLLGGLSYYQFFVIRPNEISSQENTETDTRSRSAPQIYLDNIPDGLITEPKLADAVQTKLNAGGATSEAQLESNLADVADVYTDNDFTDNSSNWDTAYGWGDHSGAGYETDTHASEHAVGGADTVFPADPDADRYLMWDDDPGELSWQTGLGGATSEAQLESNLADVADVYTDNDFTDNSSNWDTAYGWGDHSGEGYLTAETDPNALLTAGTDNVNDTHIDWGSGANQVDADDLSDGSTNAIPTLTQESNWDTAYGWGDHSGEGYLTTVDVSADTNLAVSGDGLILTDDTLSVHATLEAVADSNYTGDDAITTVGTIGTGGWEGSLITDTYIADNLTINQFGSVSAGALDAAVTLDDEWNSESEIEAAVTDVTNFYTDNDFPDNSSNWDTAYGWGDHSGEGYLTGISIGTSVGSGTSGSVLFVDSSTQLAQDNSNLFWDNGNNRLGILTTAPLYPLHVGAGSDTPQLTSGTAVYVSNAGSTNLIIRNSSADTEIGFGAWTVAFFGTRTAHDLYFQTNRTNVAVLTSAGGLTLGTSYVGQAAADGTMILSGNLGVGVTSPDTKLDVAGAITSRELSADSSNPDEGSNVEWQSDGTATGTDGQILRKITAGGVTKTLVLPFEDGTVLTTGSSLQSARQVIADADGIILTAAQMNSYILMTGAGEVQLPDVCDSATGTWVRVINKTNTNQVEVVVTDGSDAFVLVDGTVLTAGNEADLATGASDWAEFTCLETNTWYILESEGTVTDGGAAD